MAEMKTRLTGASVARFLASIDDAGVRADCRRIARMMSKATGAKPELWGSAIVGFGRYRYGPKRDREWMLIAFSPRKANITLYVLTGFPGQREMLAKLGKHSCGKGCLYLKRLDDVDRATLERVIAASARHMRARVGAS